MSVSVERSTGEPESTTSADGDDLRHEMELRGVTGRDLAKRARVSEATISHAVNGRRIHPAKRRAIVAALYAIEPLGRATGVTIDDLPEYARIAQVAELLSLSRSELYRMVEAGEVPSTRVGESAVRIPKADLRAWLAARTTVPLAGAERAAAMGSRR